MKKFGIDEAKIQVTDGSGRFKRPIAVAVTGSIMSAGLVASIAFKSHTLVDAVVTLLMVAFVLFGGLCSCIYAYVGWRFSRAVAHRLLAILGGTIAITGLVYLFWLVIKGPP